MKPNRLTAVSPRIKYQNSSLDLLQKSELPPSIPPDPSRSPLKGERTEDEAFFYGEESLLPLLVGEGWGGVSRIYARGLFILFLTTISFTSQLLKIPIATATSNRISNGQIISILGNVQLKRSYGSVIRPTTGTPLYPGDQLQTADGGQVIIQCADLSLWTLKTGESRFNNCPNQTAETQDAQCTRDIAKCPDRGDEIAWNDPTIPYIISPRRTLILTDQPVLRWNPVPGATQYTLRLSDGANEWRTQVNEPFVIYTGEFPLKPGIYYSLKIETDTGSFSFAEDVPGLGFKRLDENQQQQVNTAINQLTTWKLDDEANALSLAYLYTQYDLKSEAIKTLETLVEQGSQTAGVFRTLGNLYWQVGLANLAESRYLQAIKLATPNDIEGQAIAAAELGTLYQALGETQKAIDYLNQAISQYKTLEDLERINELNHQLEGLSNETKIQD